MPSENLPTPEYAKNMRLIGWSDQGGRPDGVQLMVHRGYAYIGHIFSKGFSVIDEMNRAFAGEKDSGFVAPVHLFTPENIEADGGPENVYDPQNGYRDAYKKIWGKS